MDIPTIKVYCKASGTEMVINESDLDTDKHSKNPIKAVKKTTKKAK